jgi:prophage antirepressor-like protein
MENNKIIVFQEKQIRSVWYEEAWWFSVVDVVEVLTETANPRRYWSDLKRKLEAEGFDQLYEKIVQLKLTAPDGKLRATDCADTPTMFRIVQTIPSPKAEPFKRWLAQVGYERVQEIEDPELAAARARDLYRAKGYPEDWIEMRMKTPKKEAALPERHSKPTRRIQAKKCYQSKILRSNWAKKISPVCPAWRSRSFRVVAREAAGKSW